MRVKRLIPAVTVLIAVPLISVWAASGRSSASDTPSVGGDSPPARLEADPQRGVRRVVLSEGAAERIGIETAPVGTLQRSSMSQAGLASWRSTPATSGDAPRTAISYSAVLYDAKGDTWVYTNPEPLVFVRQRVSIESIDGDDALLSDGPPPGTTVVTVGAAELLGTELFGFEFEVGQ